MARGLESKGAFEVQDRSRQAKERRAAASGKLFVKTSITITAKQHRRMKIAAVQQGMSMSQMFQDALEEYLDRIEAEGE